MIPLDKFVYIKEKEADDSGIFIPQRSEQYGRGKVIDQGDNVEFEIAGKEVLFDKTGCYEDKGNYIVKEENILAII